MGFKAAGTRWRAATTATQQPAVLTHLVAELEPDPAIEEADEHWVLAWRFRFLDFLTRTGVT
eukprot:COSAG01_NODE_94_length_26962_cov_9.110933_14_plen_62_part_00